ncbi:MAG: hypothetical protein WAP37_00525, partial [Solirubrobacterales bacterium]
MFHSVTIDRLLVSPARRVERLTGVPAFASASSLIAFIALVPGLFVLYSDIAVHIDFGRDTTLLTPSHTIGVVALSGMMIGVAFALVLYPQDTNTGLLWRGNRYPYGAVFSLLAGLFTMAGFPLDFLWHELFGEDVTLWSPSHLQLIGGGALSVFGFLMLSYEARRMPGWRPTPAGKFLMACSVVAGPAVISVFAAEFDFGIAQFQVLYLPPLVAFMSAATFVLARLLLGPTGALRALLIWLVLRGAVFLGVAALGLSEPRFQPYIVEALIVEAVFLLPAIGVRRAVLTAGVLIGTAGCVATFGFSRLWGYHELPWAILPQAMALATLAGVAGAVLGVAAARALAPD